MPYGNVIVEYRSDLPQGVPAVWTTECPEGEPVVRLYMCPGLPDDLAEHFRAAAHAS